ncbi:MAG: hypothetical protein HYX97_04780 [Chloroflexi bacterium]|nr:hypothetical protein [Chloroflexota bacterium]
MTTIPSAKARKIAAAVAAVQAYLELEAPHEALPPVTVRPAAVAALPEMWPVVGRLDIMQGRQLWLARPRK